MLFRSNNAVELVTLLERRLGSVCRGDGANETLVPFGDLGEVEELGARRDININHS